ncbi:MAG TPA: 2-C-methyl-D-erythritol 2,4-cyclodiphosphate synthase [Candidatus Omnitrophica bacterium]|nr:2-C-methyl-D-erythritol 2,4-cyclodiphosphate synthase [Candidatus Omnitrophota bacterium]
MRIGFGYDFHNLIEGKDLILGGVKIPYYRGLEGFSDADVLIHAICDALLGAMAEGDIGEHFPQDDERYRNISSKKIIKQVLSMLDDKKFKIVNLDTLIIAEEPKLGPFKDVIKKSLLEMLNLRDDQLNIKATTMEGKDAIGKKESIAAKAIVLIDKR